MFGTKLKVLALEFVSISSKDTSSTTLAIRRSCPKHPWKMGKYRITNLDVDPSKQQRLSQLRV